jgi:hypothetical protein
MLSAFSDFLSSDPSRRMPRTCSYIWSLLFLSSVFPYILLLYGFPKKTATSEAMLSLLQKYKMSIRWSLRVLSCSSHSGSKVKGRIHPAHNGVLESSVPQAYVSSKHPYYADYPKATLLARCIKNHVLKYNVQNSTTLLASIKPIRSSLSLSFPKWAEEMIMVLSFQRYFLFAL